MYFKEIQNRIISHNKFIYNTIFPAVCPLLRGFQILIFCKRGNYVALFEENC